MNRLLLCLLLFLPVLHQAHAQGCPTPFQPGANPWQYRGTYQNLSYGYSTRIPDGLTGVDQRNPFYQKGFTILSLGGGTLSVYAEVNSGLFQNARAAAKDNTDTLHSEFGTLASVQYENGTLGLHPAVQATTVFHCPGKQETYADISLFALNPGKRFLYTLTWQGPEEEKAAGVSALQAIERSWKFLTPR